MNAYEYTTLLGDAPFNIGEAAVLAWAETTGARVLMDDYDAVMIGRRRGVVVYRTLAVICDGIKRTELTLDDAKVLIDQLRTAGGARLPCDGDTFEEWADRHGLLAR